MAARLQISTPALPTCNKCNSARGWAYQRPTACRRALWRKAKQGQESPIVYNDIHTQSPTCTNSASFRCSTLPRYARGRLGTDLAGSPTCAPGLHTGCDMSAVGPPSSIPYLDTRKSRQCRRCRVCKSQYSMCQGGTHAPSGPAQPQGLVHPKTDNTSRFSASEYSRS